MDILDDIFDDGAVKTTKVGGKFQPKAKPRPVKKSQPVASSAVSLQSKLTGDTTVTADGQSSVLSGPSLDPPPVGSNVDARLIIPGTNDGLKSVGENAEAHIGLDLLDGLLHHPSGVESSSGTKEPSKVHEQQHAIPVDSSASGICDIQTGDVAAAQDPLTGEESIVSISGSCLETVTYPSLEAGLTPTSGQLTRKFQPKLQVFREGYRARVPDSDVGESVSRHPDSLFVHSETDLEKVKGHGYPGAGDDGDDFSPVGFDNDIIIESATEFPFHDERVLDASHSGEHPEAASQMPEKPASPSPTTCKQKLSSSDGSSFAEGNKGGRSLRSRRKSVNAHRLVDESEEVLDDDSVRNNNDDTDFELPGGNESLGKKSKKTVGDGGKRARKSTKTSESSDQTDKKKPKRVSHSTRQKRRRVDKALLETPDDEIDFQRVPIKDLILRAEHKERQMKKDAPVAQIPTTDRSAGNDENDTYASDEDGEANDKQSSPRAEDTTVYFNYQTYMDKTPSTRWSKQDTELFYEAVRQFGTDLSLIQQLFPGRTRRQVKLKYKKEERQHPSMLLDALTNRAKDHSHFEQVIENLKQIAAEERNNADNDESIDLAGEEEGEGTPKIDEEDGKSEHIEEREVEDMGQDETEMHSPVKDSESDDDWWKNCQYKP